MQNFVQLEVAALTRDAVSALSVGKARRAREQTARGFFAYGLMQGHLRDFASAFTVYGFTSAMRFDLPEFNQMVFSQYDDLYNITVKGDKNAPQNKTARSDMWETIKKGLTIERNVNRDWPVKDTETKTL